MNEAGEASWKLAELAEIAGVSPRTIRYYVQRGLLPAPLFRGRDTAYSHQHLVRLRAIRRLQERYLPLDAIQLELERLSPSELQALADEEERGAMAIPGDVGGQREAPGPVSIGPPVSSPPPVSRWERWELAAGLELHVSDGAGADVRALAEELRLYVVRRNGQGGWR